MKQTIKYGKARMDRDFSDRVLSFETQNFAKSLTARVGVRRLRKGL